MSTSTFLPIKIGDRRYVADLKGYVDRPLTSQRQMQDFSREPSDASLEAQGVWKRTQDDFIHGSGQRYYDHLEESDRRRFRWSRGIDVWDRRQLTLLNDTELIYSDMATSAIARAIGDYMYIGTDDALTRSDGSSQSTCTGTSGNITGIENIGTTVFVSTASGLYTATAGGTSFSTLGALTPDILGSGGGRLVGADGALLYEVLNDGSKTDIYTHFDTGFAWKKIIAAPNGIYCFGDNSQKSTGWLLTVVDATGELAAPYPVLDMPPGEFIRDVLFFGGVIVLATSKGFRLSTISGSGFLTAGPLVEIADIKCLSTDGRDIWFGWTAFDTQSGLGRMRPERFTDTLVPAYASDLMSAYTGTVHSCCNYNGKTYMAVQDGANVRFVGEDTVKEASGTFFSGGIAYGTPEQKAFTSVEGFWDALPAGAQVDIQVLDGVDGSAQAGSVSNSTTDSTNERADLTNAYEGEEAEVKITLARATDTSVAPVVRRWTTRAMVLPYRSREIILPVIIHSNVMHQREGQRLEEQFDPLDEYEYLLGLVDGRSLVDVTIGSRTETCYVDAIGIGPDVETVGLENWTRAQDWFEGTWAVRLITVESS